VIALERLDSESLEELRRSAGESSEADPLEVSLRLRDRPDPYASALFAGALMAELGHIPLRISHEPDRAQLANVFRSGLAAALGSRGGPTTFADPASPLTAPELRATWTPGMATFRGAMFGAGPEQDVGLFGPLHAIFLNPHRTTTPPGPSSITRVVRRWLGSRLTGEAAERHIADVGFALDQLVVNVTEHAVTEETPSVSSQVRIEIDPGAGGAPGSLLLSVLDTGAGIARTLRAKLAEPPPDAELLPALMEGRLQQWGRARGIGLSRLTQLVQEAKGTMSLAVRGSSVSVSEDEVTAIADASAAMGSVISLRLPLLG